MAISTDKFMWLPQSRQFVADLSCLLSEEFQTNQGGGYATFTLRSARTGRDVLMVQRHTEWRDGEVLWDDFAPANRDDRNLFTVRIFND